MKPRYLLLKSRYLFLKPRYVLLPILCGMVVLSVASLVESQVPTAIPTAIPSLKPASLPPTIATKVIETMAGEFGADRKAFKVTQTTPVTWQDCLPLVDRNIRSNCSPQNRSGWRVRVTGKGEVWQYLAAADGRVVLDGLASLSPKVRVGLAKALNRDAATLRFQAVQLVQNVAACPVGAMCKMAPNPAWKILLNDDRSPYTMTLPGKRVELGSFASFLPPDLVGLPPSYGEAVLRDVRDRADGLLGANFRVESLKAITWNECGGGDPAPSQPARGICPDITREGWQMVTLNGPVRWVHYLTKPDMTPVPPIASVTPDGRQSLPRSIATALIQATAKRDKQPVANYQIHWADATFFDGCLNPVGFAPKLVNPAIGCRQRVQSGWQVDVIGNTSSNAGQPLTTYYVNAVGTDYRLISQTQWLPPP
jgi:hypothetical protein